MTSTPVAAAKAAGALTLAQHLALASYWFAFNALWGAMLFIAVPKHMELLESQGRLLLFGAHLNKAAAEGWTLGIGATLAALIPPIAGAMSDRCRSRIGRRRPYVFVGTAVLVLGLWWLWLALRAGDFGSYLAGFLVLQLGANIGYGAYAGAIPDLVPPAERGTASGWMAVMTQIGFIVGAFGAGVLVDAGRYGMLTAALTAVVAIAVGCTLVGVREPPLATAPPFRWRDLLLSFWVDPIRYPDFAWLWLSRAAVTFGVYLITPFLIYFLADVVRVQESNLLPPGLRQPGTMMGIWMATALVAATPMGLVGAKISDRIGRRIVVCLSTLVMAGAALGFIALGALATADARVIVAVILGIVWGIGYGAFSSVDWALGTECLPRPEDAGKDMGVWHLSMTIPQALAPIVSGAFVLSAFRLPGTGEHTAYAPIGYALLFALAAAWLTAGALLVFKIKKVR